MVLYLITLFSNLKTMNAQISLMHYFLYPEIAYDSLILSIYLYEPRENGT